MSGDERVWPDIELGLIEWAEENFGELKTQGTQRYVDSSTEGQDLLLLPQFVTISLVGGSDDRVTDRSIVDFDVYSKSRMVAHHLARAIRERLGGYPFRVGSTGAWVDRVVTEEKPRPLPTSDPKLWRYGATYEVHARRHRER